MATSKKTFAVTLHVDTATKFKRLYGHRIGVDKEFKNPAQAINEMIEGVFLEYYRD